MKERTLQFKGQSPAQMLTIDAELRLMSNQWRRVGVQIDIDGKSIPKQKLRESTSRKRQATSFKPRAGRIWS